MNNIKRGDLVSVDGGRVGTVTGVLMGGWFLVDGAQVHGSRLRWMDR